ncbi:MAG TPA: flagellar basal body rod protein FlgB [Opitutaceae bacterium]|nr:flagellar basal body rod protein FlgB [Opitutaceae bacterium]
MIDPIFQTDNYQLARKLLDVTVLRQQAIASNIANSDTPGYHRLDIAPDFAAQLKARLADGDGAKSIDSLQPQLAQDPNARTVRPDGNNVELGSELVAMDKNTVDFNFLSQVVTYDLKQMKMAITGQVV